MRGSLGEKIGEGATADVHAWAPGQVVRLFKADFPQRLARHEARMTRAAFAAGTSAPEGFDEVTVDGRFGIVLARLDGPTLRQLLLTRAVTSEQAGSILAAQYLSVHKTPPPPDVLSLRKMFEYGYRDVLPPHIAPGILALIERLPPGDVLCHKDLHAGNVIMTADGPRIIDWLAMVRADAALDLGRCHLHFSELIYAPEDTDPERPHALNAAVQSEYARLAGICPAALTAAMQRYLPILRAFALADHATNPFRRERLLRSVEATLRSEDA
jgi:hypothetical protein